MRRNLAMNLEELPLLTSLNNSLYSLSPVILSMSSLLGSHFFILFGVRFSNAFLSTNTPAFKNLFFEKKHLFFHPNQYD